MTEPFVSRWTNSSASERANSQLFLSELCMLLDMPQPDPSVQDESLNAYVFEKHVAFNNGDGTTSPGRIDLYKQGCFVLESKQGSEAKSAQAEQKLATVNQRKKLKTGTAARGTPAWDQAMVKARQQAKRYAEALPEWPPFLIVVDVGHCFDLYADFSQSGKNYIPFPDPQNFRFRLADLAQDDVRRTLRTIWTEPQTLDPSRKSAKVTRELADRLAKLAKSLERQTGADAQPRYTPERVAQFLMRCLFTLFAEDVELIGKNSFKDLLESLCGSLPNFGPLVEELWQKMNTGGFSVAVRQQLRQFNGGLFADCEALPLDADQLELLIEAAEAEWSAVEPAIFGTLLERALDPIERHKLGAHYTPRAYVERLVMPTIIEPLRAEWDIAYAAAVQLDTDGKTAEAVKTVREFHEHLCEIRVLDPACGSGNFLYVSLELMKRLEGEVLNALREFGERQMPLLTIDPHQFLGIEVNPRAAAITELVLWIGYLQWHFRSIGRVMPPEPIIRNFHNIECRDAVLAWDAVESVFDDDGKPVTRWDGRTTKPHPVTGEEVPDETARVQELRYVNPRKAEWPQADYIVGNPPFIGDKRQNTLLGVGYVEALRAIYTEVPPSADYVMYWWHKAADRLAISASLRFGLITTNSIRQSFNRRVVLDHLLGSSPVALAYVIPDHPWVASEDGAAVRISMTVASRNQTAGVLSTVAEECETDSMEHGVRLVTSFGKIAADLTLGPPVATATRLSGNRGVCCNGVGVYGRGFVLSPDEAMALRATVPSGIEPPIRQLLNGRDITDGDRGRFVIDLFGHSEEEVRSKYPAIYQWIVDRVRPERLQNNRASYRRLWWIFGEPRATYRPALVGLRRYIGTPRTAKHRVFVFVPGDSIVETEIVSFAFEKAYLLGLLSSRIHLVWASASGSVLEDRPRYNASICFDRFPFPSPNHASQERIRDLGEQLDAHRKRQQTQHPDLTMTGMYNVLEKLRSGEPLTKKEQPIHEQGLVSVLRQIHDDLDAAVFDAYGWPHDLSDEEILQRLVDLNRQRAEEERRGLVRWLRPEFQNPQGAAATQQELGIEEQVDDETPVAQPGPPKKQPWPATLREQVRAVREALTQLAAPVSPADVAKCFTRAPKATVAELLDTLADVGQARQTEDGRYVA